MPKRRKLFAGDLGNALIKWALEDVGETGVAAGEFPHYFLKITETEWRQTMKRVGGQDPDYFKVNGIPYVFGEKAMRMGGFTRRSGETRYSQDYYGVLAAVALTVGLQKSHDNIWWVGSYPPGDIDYSDNLTNAVYGDWQVEWKGKGYDFSVTDAFAIDEPLAGYNNRVLKKGGAAYDDKAIRDGYTLVLDIGGHTTDAVPVGPKGNVDFLAARSVDNLGIISVINDVRRNFRSQYAKLLEGSALDDDMVQGAIKTGLMDLRGLGVHECQQIVTEATQDLMARIRNFYQDYGGATRFNTILLTGGGCALLENVIRETIRHQKIMLAHKEATLLHRANAEGLIKTIQMAEATGQI